MTVYDVTINDTRCVLNLTLTNGCLEFSGCDTGKTPMECFGENQYEYWMKLDEDGTRKLLQILVQEHNTNGQMTTEDLLKLTFNDLNATAILREKCEANNIKIQFHCWP